MNKLLEFDEIYISKQFFEGQHKNGFSVDVAYLEDKEILAISKWIFNIKNKVDHAGRNKPSCLDPSGKLADASTQYINAGAYHYHCGPNYRPIQLDHVDTPWNLPMNLNGCGSVEIVHYSQKQFKELSGVSLTIFGFSRTHIPFPHSDGNKRNPLRSRLHQIAIAVSSESVFGV